MFRVQGFEVFHMKKEGKDTMKLNFVAKKLWVHCKNGNCVHAYLLCII